MPPAINVMFIKIVLPISTLHRRRVRLRLVPSGEVCSAERYPRPKYYNTKNRATPRPINYFPAEICLADGNELQRATWLPAWVLRLLKTYHCQDTSTSKRRRCQRKLPGCAPGQFHECTCRAGARLRADSGMSEGAGCPRPISPAAFGRRGGRTLPGYRAGPVLSSASKGGERVPTGQTMNRVWLLHEGCSHRPALRKGHT